MPELMSLTNAFTTHIAARTDALVEQWSSGNCNEVIELYNKTAKMIDADGKTVVRGKEELIEYLKITFEYAHEHGCPPIKLRSQRMFDDGYYIFDVGSYTWQNLHNGRYVHKWGWVENDWYIVEDYFTIEQSFN